MKFILLCVLALSFAACNGQEDNSMNGDNGLSYLALGDSYTIGESVEEKGRWPVQLKDSLSDKGVTVRNPEIIATTGWRTDQLKEALALHEKFDYDMVSLLIGVNNQFQGKSVESYTPEFEELLNLAIERAGGDEDRVFVVSIPDYGFTPFGEGNKSTISKALDEYNAVNKQITLEKGIRYFDITPISRRGLEDPDLVASDSLHPSGKQYSLWVAEMMKDEGFIAFLKLVYGS